MEKHQCVSMLFDLSINAFQPYVHNYFPIVLFQVYFVLNLHWAHFAFMYPPLTLMYFWRLQNIKLHCLSNHFICFTLEFFCVNNFKCYITVFSNYLHLVCKYGTYILWTQWLTLLLLLVCMWEFFLFWDQTFWEWQTFHRSNETIKSCTSRRTKPFVNIQKDGTCKKTTNQKCIKFIMGLSYASLSIWKITDRIVYLLDALHTSKELFVEKSVISADDIAFEPIISYIWFRDSKWKGRF